jgi:hypothetical protein
MPQKASVETKPKEVINKIPQNATVQKAEKIPEKNKVQQEVKPKVEQPKKELPPKQPKIEQPKKLEPQKIAPKKQEQPKQPPIPPKNARGFSSLRDKLIMNMQSREKPPENTTPSEPIKVMKSDAMKNMVEAMNRHYEESSDTQDEPIQIITGGPSVPPPPPMTGGGIDPPKIGVPPPPPPPPPVVFDPSKVPKKPNKPVVKKPPPPKQSSSTNSAPSMKEQLMKVALKKVGK